MKEESFLVDFFDRMLKNYLSLEKSIFELVAVYNQEPIEQTKNIIVDLCNNGKVQISLLMELAPKISKGKELEKYQVNLELKNSGLFYVGKKISESYHK